MKPLRIGVIGANLQGSWGANAHLPALAALDGLEASAVATSHQDSADATAAHFGVPHAFDDPRRLVEHPDVDAVAVCVRVPAHRELVMLALDAGKPIYCEWPLARDTAEAQALHDAAEAAGVAHMVGLQSRHAPALLHAKALIAEGAIGTVRSAALTHSVDWISEPFPSIAYLQDRASGAHFLSIPGGHSIDALCWLLGEYESLSATVRTSLRQLKVFGTGEPLTRTSADHVLVSGELEGGVVASVRLSGASSPGTGVRLEISGDDGDLVITAPPGTRGIQMSELRLQKTAGMGELAEIEIPEHRFHVPAALRAGPPLNVAESYLDFARAVRGEAVHPSFADAVHRHRTLDAVEAAAREGRSLKPD